MNIRSTSLSFLVGALFATSAWAASATPSMIDLSSSQDQVRPLILTEAHQHQEREGRGEGRGEGRKRQGQADQAGQAGQGGHGAHGGGKHGGGKHGGDKHGEKKAKKDKKDKGHGHHGYAHIVATHADALGLSDEQLGKIARQHMRDDKEHKRLKESMKQSMKALRKAIMDPGSDEETIHELGKSHVKEFSAMVRHHVRERKAVHEVLTPEQLEQLQSMEISHDDHDH
ncbi:Spy/CpxP family protein refolding chaperone [Nitrosomonas halophila]|uniref:LTXXQ motif family protein n=1 Tax=Nitrosomonas halophila TaxID=44576 RepID=A0A1H3PDV2_9PROT|nr:Spy/CpxP family protein refolding chaperone [Nitrosomonas halophila]SDY99237.1 LTXXQ motif family protein [Nitrosomonas halophila]